MRSETVDSAAPAGRFDWLFSQGLGLFCGQATVLLMAIGSVVIVKTREGASAGVQMDDLTVFFREPSWVHAWFYALAGVLALYALNTALCTWVSVVSRWKQGVRQLSAYAPPIIHVSFLVALLAHGVGGLWNAERESIVLSRAWLEIGKARQARLVDVQTEALPDGKTKSVQARVEVRAADGSVSEHVVGYNQPMSSGFGAELFLLSQAGQTISAIRLASGVSTCTLASGGSCELEGLVVTLVAVQESSRTGAPLAVMRVVDARRRTSQVFLNEGQERSLEGGGTLRFLGAIAEPAIALRVREAPGNPIALASAVLLAIGLGLMGRRWLMV